MPAPTLEGRVALVTGSTGGIGAAVARALGAAGATVVVNSTTSFEAGEELAAELGRASYVQGDIAADGAARTIVDHVLDRHGRLDVLVNNAGVTQVIPHADLGAATPDVWRHILGVNVIGTWNMCAAAIPHLRRSDVGAVVNVSSLAGVRPGGSSIPYAVSKAAVNHMTRLLANAVGPEVRVNAVAPGFVETPWTSGFDGLRDFVVKNAPLQRTASPEEVADVVLHLVLARYQTGDVVLVDGGLHLRGEVR